MRKLSVLPFAWSLAYQSYEKEFFREHGRLVILLLDVRENVPASQRVELQRRQRRKVVHRIGLTTFHFDLLRHLAGFCCSNTT